MRGIGGFFMALALAAGQPPASVEFRHLCTFGSKEGIHPPKILDRKVSTAALGKSGNPHGLLFPVAVAVDRDRRVWIADTGTASVHIFDIGGSYREIRRVGQEALRQPSGLAADRQGRIFLTDAGTGAIYSFDETGEFAYAVVKPGSGTLRSPTAIALSEDEKTIYVADEPRNVVVALNREGELNQTIALPPELVAPASLAIASNQIYVLGGIQHQAACFSPAGKSRGAVRWDGVPAPTAIAYDAARHRFLIGNPRWMTVEIFNEAGRNLGAFGHAGNGVDQALAIDALHVDSHGLLYVIDSHHGKVLVFGETWLPRQ